ncbi:MAG: biopolymer transport protein ExbB [Pseudoalteromonas tetraodonis]|jgi:biopolymer transport protein ExbB
MDLYYYITESVTAFRESGGWVLKYIGLVMLVMWALILERIAYLWFGMKKDVSEVMDIWETRPERKSWEAHQIRTAMIARVKANATRSIPMINTLVAVCPLMGLMGTVTGMIQVFDVMALMGSGNARAMAAGVSAATIPTMAGMVGALSGVFFGTILEKKASTEQEHVANHLTMDH